MIILAIDGLKYNGEKHVLSQFKTIIDELGPYIHGVKINDLADRYGAGILSLIPHNLLTMVDLKMRDIPNTIANRVSVWDEAGADFITVNSDIDSLKAANSVVEHSKIISVGQLTSSSPDNDDRIINVIDNIKNAKKTKSFGIVSCMFDLACLNYKLTSDIAKFVPGIRFINNEINKDDQRNITFVEKINPNLIDYVIVGRSILNLPTLDHRIEHLNILKDKIMK